jgi:SH3-like domain-containing protein
MTAVLASTTVAAANDQPNAKDKEGQTPQLAASATGLPVPRFASLRVDKVNLRQGPSTDYPIAWIFQRTGLPVEILREFEGWRQIRDADGTTGWMQGAAISGRRTAIVAPWDAKPDAQPVQLPLTSQPSGNAETIAVVEPGVIVNILSCDGKACRVSVDQVRGFIPQQRLWGVYPNEVIN